MSWKALAPIGAVILLVAVGLGLAIGLVDGRLTRQDEEAAGSDPLDSMGLGPP
jgi:FlaG/FlaF family flagellin (archaellin)